MPINNMPNGEYHATPALGSSGIKLLKQSPAHYFAAYRDPARKPREATPAQKIGSAWHAAVFEPATFGDHYIAVPDGLDKRTKEGKALWAEIEASGRTAFAPDQFDEICAMAASAARHPVSRVIFNAPGGAAEQSIFQTDPVTGVAIKIRPDYMVPPCDMFPTGLLVDGKTGEDMSPEGFAKYAWNWDLHIQAAFYSDVFQLEFCTDQPPAFVWLAQEKSAPYACAYYSAAADFVQYGRKLYRPMLALLSECERSQHWPTYPQTVMPLELPVWAAKQVQEGVAV